MIDHDKNVGSVLDKIDQLGLANDTIVFYSTDNGPHMNSWPDAAMTPFRNEKNSNWEGAFRVPAMVRWPGKIKPGSVSNEIMSHLDWMPTLLAAAGMPDIKEKLLTGYKAGDMTCRRAPRQHDGRTPGSDVAEVICASPVYLKKFGKPKSPEHLDGHEAIEFYSTARRGVFPLEFIIAGKAREIALPSREMVEGAETMVTLARLGFGIIQVPRYHVARDIEEGRLVQILDAWRPSPMPISVLYPENRQLYPRSASSSIGSRPSFAARNEGGLARHDLKFHG